MNKEDVFPKIREIIADVLVIDEETIQPTSRLIQDLGAESIDFLDLIFQLEKTFQIKIPRGQIERNARGHLSEAEFEKGGEITPQGLDVLKAYLSEVPAEHFKSHMKLADIPMLFTVETFCKLVTAASAEQQACETVV
ncbi:MAG: acyl carrier protein [Gammaproteobacteria bacterium]|nr:acyl carrier protein [Gammaproteobacteria bacterium]